MNSPQFNTTYNQQNSHQGAWRDRLQGRWRIWEYDPNDDWIFDAVALGNRAADLVRNDPVMSALMVSKLIGTHGSEGLKFRSLYQEDASQETSPAEAVIRGELEDEIRQSSCGTQLDASGIMTRRELEEALDENATVYGECWAIRQFIPNRVGARIATCWRLIRHDRVCNPPNRVDGDNLYQGIELDDNGAPVAVWFGPPRRFGIVYHIEDFTRVPWYGPDGARNVIHRIGKRVPGAYRGISMFSSNIFMAKQTKGLLDAQVVAKRIQACHPIFIECDDPKAAAAADKNGAVWGPNTTMEPGKVYYVGHGNAVHFSSWQFQGADMKAFLDTLYRNQFSAWGMPIDVVLAQLGNTNMAASRSAWLQYYRQCTRWQDDHREQVSKIIDESIIREAVARGRIKTPLTDWNRIMIGRYVRPPRSMPDPLKEAMAVKEWASLGRDLTGLFAESGVDFRESIMERAMNDKFLEAQGVTIDLGAPAPPADAANDDPAAPQPSEDPDQDPAGSPGGGDPGEAP